MCLLSNTQGRYLVLNMKPPGQCADRPLPISTTGPHTPDSLTKYRIQYSANQPPPGYKREMWAKDILFFKSTQKP